MELWKSKKENNFFSDGSQKENLNPERECLIEQERPSSRENEGEREREKKERKRKKRERQKERKVTLLKFIVVVAIK